MSYRRKCRLSSIEIAEGKLPESRENTVGRMAVIWQTGMLQDFVSILSKLQIQFNGEILFKGFKFVDVG